MVKKTYFPDCRNKSLFRWGRYIGLKYKSIQDLNDFFYKWVETDIVPFKIFIIEKLKLNVGYIMQKYSDYEGKLD